MYRYAKMRHKKINMKNEKNIKKRSNKKRRKKGNKNYIDIFI